MSESLRGQLLVASPALVDPNFRRTVVLVVAHDEDGAVGIVLNRPTDTEVVEAVPDLAELVEPDAVVSIGGPVQDEAVVVLAEWEDTNEAGSIVFENVGLMNGESDSERIVAATRRVRIFAGYAGWGGGQLEAELEEPSWILERARPEDVFGDDADLWASVVRRKGGPFTLIATMPEDPSLN
jgi:putative transcriptional regulator